MARFPQQDFNTMRQDAIRRSREMQRRANPPVRREPAPVYPGEDLPPKHLQKQPVHTAQPSLPKELQGLLQDWDGERIALLALLYLLYREGTDPKLLLAIAYILL